MLPFSLGDVDGDRPLVAVGAVITSAIPMPVFIGMSPSFFRIIAVGVLDEGRCAGICTGAGPILITSAP